MERELRLLQTMKEDRMKDSRRNNMGKKTGVVKTRQKTETGK